MWTMGSWALIGWLAVVLGLGLTRTPRRVCSYIRDRRHRAGIGPGAVLLLLLVCMVVGARSTGQAPEPGQLHAPQVQGPEEGDSAAGGQGSPPEPDGLSGALAFGDAGPSSSSALSEMGSEITWAGDIRTVPASPEQKPAHGQELEQVDPEIPAQNPVGDLTSDAAGQEGLAGNPEVGTHYLSALPLASGEDQEDHGEGSDDDAQEGAHDSETA